MVSRAFMGGLGLVLLATLGVVVATRQRSVPGAGPEQPPPARAPVGSPRALEPDRGFLGVVVTEESVDLAARFAGRVESVRVHVGEVVRQGEVVATLEAAEPRRELAMAEAELRSRRAEQEVAALALEEAGARLRRREAPEQLRTGAISEEELSAVRYEQRMAAAKLEVARARVGESEARVERLRLQVAEASLRAPFEGVVASRFVHPGALVQAGQPLVHLLRQGAQRVRFAVPGASGQVVVGRAVEVVVPEREGVLAGRVVEVAPEVDVASQMVFALAELEAGGEPVRLPSGTVVRVKLLAGEARAGADNL